MRNVTDKIKRGSVVAATSATSILLTMQSVQAQDGLTLKDGVGSADPGTGENLFGDGGIFQTIANVLLFLVGAISVIMLIVGGIRYVVSAGDQQAVTNAKNTILYAIVGIVVAFLAFAAVTFVVDSLEGN